MKSQFTATRRAVLCGIAAIAGSSVAPSIAGETAMTASTLTGRKLVQVALTVRDLKRTIPFYRDTLGLTFMFETNGMAFFDMGGQRLLVGESRNKGEPIGGSVIYFDAPDIDALVPSLEKRGVVFNPQTEILQRTETYELKLREFKDPDGNSLALMGMVPRA